MATPIEPNFKLINYSCCDNTVTRRDALIGAAIHCWRRSDNGVISNNQQVNSAHIVTESNAPGIWETSVNILFYNNVTV